MAELVDRDNDAADRLFRAVIQDAGDAAVAVVRRGSDRWVVRMLEASTMTDAYFHAVEEFVQSQPTVPETPWER